jgi:hypothetical protein
VPDAVPRPLPERAYTAFSARDVDGDDRNPEARVRPLGSTMAARPVRPRSRRLPLRGADLVLMARHPRWKGVGLSHNALLVVECDGTVGAGRIARALERFLDAGPWPAARLRRPFPWGGLEWVAGPREKLRAAPVRQAMVGTRKELEQELVTELNAGIDPRSEPPVRALLLEGEPEQTGAASILVLTWFHSLMDARGGQNLLAHLDHLDGHDGPAPWGDGLPAFVPGPDTRSLRERGRVAGRGRRYLRALAPVPPVSPARELAPPGRACFRRESFLAPDLSPDDRRLTREISWRLALVGKAMADLWRRRSLPDVPFLIPISVDLRPKGEAGPTFGNLLAFHFARFRPSDTRDVPGLARALRRQMADAVREGQIEANAAGMEFLRYCPPSMMLRVLPWTKGGELFSFNCADLADWPPDLASCFGQRVVNAYHIPVVPPRPGIGVFFNRCGSRNNLVVSWIEGVVSDDDVTRIIDVVREGLGWARIP